MNLEQIEKGGYDHFMLKEIYEQPNVIKDTYRGRLHPSTGVIQMSGIEDNLEKFLNADRIIIIACGTSWHAGLVAEYVIEEFARIPVEVEYASEFRYRNPIITSKDIVIAISQSGETADTLAAIKLAKEKGAKNHFRHGKLNLIKESDFPLMNRKIISENANIIEDYDSVRLEKEKHKLVLKDVSDFEPNTGRSNAVLKVKCANDANNENFGESVEEIIEDGEDSYEDIKSEDMFFNLIKLNYV
jgi:hypothetical protein